MAAHEATASFDRARVHELVLLLVATAVALGLRLIGAADLPWAREEVDSGAWLRGSMRLLALCTGTATAPLAFALLRSSGRGPAVAIAFLVALSPWHVHASRLATLTPLGFLGLLVAARWVGIGERRATPFPESRIGIVLAGLALIGASFPGEPGPRSFAGIAPAELLAGSVGLAVPLLAALHLLRREHWNQLADAALLGAAGFLIGTKWPGRIDPVAALLAPLFLAAAAELGLWIAAIGSWRARAACVLAVIAPTLPSLVSEHLDGGRYDLAPIARAFARARRGGEPLYASDPALASRILGAEARPLAELPEPLPADERAFVLLLLDRGRPVGGEALPADLESGLDLVARTGEQRLDLHRYEARLYRSGPRR